MQREYPITAEGTNIGTAYISVQGLYYEVRCVCKMQQRVLHIEADCGNRRENIGICVPKDGKMVISTRIAQKRLDGLTGFVVRAQVREAWMPLDKNRPVGHLYGIGEARFAFRDGKPGLLIPIPEEREASHPNQKSENTR